MKAIYFKLGKFNESLNYCKAGSELSQKLQSQRLIYNACRCLFLAYEAKEDYQNAYFYYKEYDVAKDSVDGIQKAELFEEIESKFELKEKEALIANQELTIATEQNKLSRTIIAALIFLVLISVIFLALRSRLLKRRREAEITAEKEHLEAEKLRALDKIKSSFFTNISHEIRTPLTLIMSPLEQMLNGSLKGSTAKYHKIMYRNGKRLQALINQLLDLSKIESGHLQLNLVEGDLSQFLSVISSSFNSLADRKQIEYHVKLLPDGCKGYFDQDIMGKILMNLISNAFKFTPEEGKIDLLFNYENSILSIEVADNGIGIPEDQIDSIFDRFYSTEQKSEIQMSSGIGLALTKELVDLCEGSIRVKSQLHSGTTFEVSIPVLASSEEIGSNQSVEQVPEIDKEGSTLVSAPQDSESIQKANLLIVEDNEDVRTYLKDQLSDKYSIFEAEHGKGGLDLARKELPDLIISDIMMPQMDGNEMCKLLKTDALTSHIPIILLTAKGEQKDKLEGLETGADAYLTKPFDHTELQVRVHNLVEQRRMLRAKFSSDFKFTPAEVTLTSLDAQFLIDVKSTIESNMEDESFSVEELSTAVGMSRSNLFRKLKALTDQSPNQVIREMRLIRAKELLEKGAGNSAEVAYMVGFNSPTYFSKCFNDFYGVSPGKIMN